MLAARYRWLVAALAFLGSAPRAAAESPPAHRRAVLISLDGAGAALLEDAVARGLMPHLARLRANGAVARGMVTSRPGKTAPGHAALFTGAWSDRNGIGGNLVSVPGASVLDSESGFSSRSLRAEPLWAAVARQGLRATVVSAPQTFPFEPYLVERRFGGHYRRELALVNGHQNLYGDDQVYTARELAADPPRPWLAPLPRHRGAVLSIRVPPFAGGPALQGVLYDEPADATVGLDTLLLAVEGDAGHAIRLKAPPAQGPRADAFAALPLRLPAGPTAVHFRLFQLSPDGSEILLYRVAPGVVRVSPAEIEAAVRGAAGGFVANGASALYDRGRLGPPLWQGGDGTAERRYLETVALAIRQLTRLTDAARVRTHWDLLVTYLPFPDEALHAWWGYLDASLPGHDTALAARLSPHLDDVLRLCDAFLGHLAAEAGPRAALVVAADHGMEGMNHLFRPNRALLAAGLLQLDEHGQVDLARSRAVYHEGQFVLINRRSRKRGIVDEGEEDEVRRQVRAALLAVVDPTSGRPVVRDVLDARTPGLEPALGGPGGGDLYLSLAPACNVSAALQGPMVETTPPRGNHLLDPEREALHAGLVLSGPGIARADLGLVREVDVAATVCAWLGVGAPLQSVGRVLEGALAPRPAAGSGRRGRRPGRAGEGPGASMQ